MSGHSFSNPALAASTEELEEILKAIAGYRRLPFASESVPGAYVEAVVARFRGGEVKQTYDFVDVVNMDTRVGWQVKSTKAKTPVTWKRAKIANAADLIRQSYESEEAVQALGDAVIDFCNQHAIESLELYDLDAIGYCRTIATAASMTYFERELVTRESPQLFDASSFEWAWSKAKVTKRKEQLSALHGRRREGGEKWFAAHLLGENQLHFSGESAWWPDPSDTHRVDRPAASEQDKLSWDNFVTWLTQVEAEMEAPK